MTQNTHTSLYRKYRPASFADISGQDHIVRVLQSAIEKKTPHHAYLFTGTRGVGKTSIARIFAKELGVEPEDITEIDAASYTGVDNVRELTESAMTLPFLSPYKVYILDEVHMLSKAAFNAFLKGLEEPPRHVIYILATTELSKLPDTIISRCEVHTFQTPSLHTLGTVVNDVCKKEGYSIDTDSVILIAMTGDGSFRDTLGVLQKVMSSIEGKKISLDKVEYIIGTPKVTSIDTLVDMAISKDEKVSDVLDEIRGTNTDGKLMYDMYVEKLREKLRSKETSTEEKVRVLELLSRALSEYRHLRFVDPMAMLEVVVR
ncbi:MAG: DNA polymerase III subunit gamma/tau [Patescibacteria group bacterium]